MPVAYNPVTDSFSTFENVETPKVEINFPLLDSPLDITSWSTGISAGGTPIVDGPTLPRMINSEKSDNTPTLNIDTANTESYNFNDSITDRRKEAYAFFKSKGLSDIHSAAIIGNLMAESGPKLDPRAENPSSKAYGIAQWLGSRKRKLISLYGSKPTFNQQLEFLWNELNSEEKPAFNDLLKTNNLNDAVESFMSKFERPSEKEMNSSRNTRRKYAKSIFIK